jgi:hypothetical protein
MQQQLDTCLQALSSLTERHEALEKRARLTEGTVNEIAHSGPGAYKQAERKNKLNEETEEL